MQKVYAQVNSMRSLVIFRASNEAKRRESENELNFCVFVRDRNRRKMYV